MTLALGTIPVSLLILSLCCVLGKANETLQGKIVNGTQAKEGEFPFAVSLRYAKTGRHFCAGSLLNHAWILTAAHCLRNTKPTQINIQYGSRKINRNSSHVANVSKIFVHEGFNPSDQFINDIALLKVRKALNFSKTVRAIRLPDVNIPTLHNTSVVLIGWGLNASGGVVQEPLQKVHLYTFSNEECSARHQSRIHNTTLCAGVPEGGKGQCSGDSGGPLLINGTTQLGIVSWSRKPCAKYPFPGVFTRVSAYIDWIAKTIGDEIDRDANSDSESLEEIQSGDLIIVRRRNPLNHVYKSVT